MTSKTSMTSKETNHIDIAIIGAVSAGKSTLTNALFVEQYSDMNIKRTTTMPQVYYSSNDINLFDNIKNIRENNRLINEKYMYDTSKGIELKYEDIQEIKYIVPPVYDFINLKSCNLVIHDLPGLNDSMTKAVYHKYVISSFSKYDIIIFVIDIFSSLNTSDEIDILKLILHAMKSNKEQYNLDCKLIILLNKCDELEKDNITQEYLPSDTELLGMVKQVKNIVETNKKEIYSGAIIDIICVSCEDAYIYRMYSRNHDTKLDIKYLNKFGSNEYGKTRWNKLNESQKMKQIQKLFKKFNYTDRIKDCGFIRFKKSINDYLTDIKQFIILTNRIYLNLEKSINTFAETSQFYINISNNHDNTIKMIDEIKNNETKILDLHKKYNKKHNLSEFEKQLYKFTNYFEKSPTNYLMDGYTIKNEYEYANSMSLQNILQKLIFNFNITYSKFNLDISNNIIIITTNINNYIYNQIINEKHEFTEKIKKIKILQNNFYDDEQLFELIYDCFSNIYGSYATEFTKLLTYGTILLAYDTIENKLIELLIMINKEFNIPYDMHIKLIFSNMINYVKIFLHDHSHATSSENTDNLYNIVINKNAYITSFYIKSNNSYNIMVCKYKMYLDKIVDMIIPYIDININKIGDNIQYTSIIDKYFINILKEQYNDEIISIDDIITYHKNITNNKNSEDTKNITNNKNSEDTKNITKNTKISENTEDNEDSENTEENEDNEDSENTEENEDTLSEDLDNDLQDSDNDSEIEKKPYNKSVKIVKKILKAD